MLATPLPTWGGVGGEAPHDESVDGSQRVVACHTCITIQAVLPVENDVKGGHDDTYHPEGNMSTILQPDIYQAEYRGQYVKPVQCHALRS